MLKLLWYLFLGLIGIALGLTGMTIIEVSGAARYGAISGKIVEKINPDLLSLAGLLLIAMSMSIWEWVWKRG